MRKIDNSNFKDQDGRASITLRSVPTALTVLRIPLSLSLLAITPFTAPFALVYVLCGVTDVLDGFTARKLKVESQFGACLDSVADVTFFVVVFFTLLKVLQIPLALTIWAFSIILVRFMGLLAAFKKYHSWAALHTITFKVLGFAFFLFPLLVWCVGVLAAGIALLTLASFATIEEIYINMNTVELNLDTRGVFIDQYKLPGNEDVRRK